MAPRTPFVKAIALLMGSTNGIRGARHTKFANMHLPNGSSSPTSQANLHSIKDGISDTVGSLSS